MALTEREGTVQPVFTWKYPADYREVIDQIQFNKVAELNLKNKIQESDRVLLEQSRLNKLAEKEGFELVKHDLQRIEKDLQRLIEEIMREKRNVLEVKANLFRAIRALLSLHSEIKSDFTKNHISRQAFEDYLEKYNDVLPHADMEPLAEVRNRIQQDIDKYLSVTDATT